MIELQGVTKRYDKTIAVDGIDYRFQPGKLTGFLGPNGAGKSTTIRMIMNIIAPDSGRITAGGLPLSESFRNRLGYLPEERGLYKKMKVIDHLTFFGTLKGLKRGEAKRRSLAWLEKLGLAERAQSKVEDLSKGMQQKIQFAGTLLHEPELVLLDEPFSGLDPLNVDAFKEVLLGLKAKGCTLIFSTHMMEQAEQLCDEIALIDKGRLVLAGTLPALRASFGRSNLRVRFAGDAAILREDARVADYGEPAPGLAELRLVDAGLVSAVLRDWSARLEIEHFEVMVPSLHNIFVHTVTAAGAARQEGATWTR